MPYLIQSRRDELLDGQSPDTPGDLNFLFTTIAKDYVNDKGESYQIYNDVIGALECAKLELYRRQISAYEQQKIVANGDLE